jgi:clan AA aspartic protease
MGETYVPLTLTNLFNKKSFPIRALVDTGATYLIVTAAVAEALGFDLDELSVSNVTVADGRRIRAPCISPLRLVFEDRACVLEAVVLGDQNLLGFIPLEMMDLMVDPVGQRLIGRHAEGPVHRA